MSRMVDERHFPVIWVLMRLNGRKGYGGFCGKTNMMYTFDLNPMSPLVIQDIIVDQDRCEEAEGCLYQKCPLNRTTPASYWKRHGIKGPPPKKLIGAFADGVELPEDLRGGEGGLYTTKKHGLLIEIENRPGKVPT